MRQSKRGDAFVYGEKSGDLAPWPCRSNGRGRSGGDAAHQAAVGQKAVCVFIVFQLRYIDGPHWPAIMREAAGDTPPCSIAAGHGIGSQ